MEVNENREQGGYPSEIFANLVYRYEEPNAFSRWDSPLFTVLYEDATAPCEQIWAAIVEQDGELKTARPNLATIKVGLSFGRIMLRTARQCRFESAARPGPHYAGRCQSNRRLARRSRR